MAVVVFPTPPFWLATAIIFADDLIKTPQKNFNIHKLNVSTKKISLKIQFSTYFRFFLVITNKILPFLIKTF
jgi:hypothetical protein